MFVFNVCIVEVKLHVIWLKFIRSIQTALVIISFSVNSSMKDVPVLAQKNKIQALR